MQPERGATREAESEIGRAGASERITIEILAICASLYPGAKVAGAVGVDGSHPKQVDSTRLQAADLMTASVGVRRVNLGAVRTVTVQLVLAREYR